MRMRIALFFLAFFAATSAAAAAGFSEAAKQLDGNWRGQAFVLRIDAKRAQASMALNRPFEWQRFLIKEVRDDEVTFTVGAEVFQARIDTDILTLTGTSFRGARVLYRDTGGLRGTKSN